MGIMDTLFGGQKSSSKTKAFSGADAQKAWNLATSPEYAGAEPTTEMPGFQWDWYNPERYIPKRLTGGDYQALEESLAATPLRRLMQSKMDAQGRFMAQMRKTGMGDDPSAYKLWQETGETPYTQSMTDILSNAANQRYGLQAQELQNINQLLGNQTRDINQLMAGQYGQYNPARQQYGWQQWSGPREWWRQKMGLFYSGGKGASESQSSGFGGVIPGLGGGQGIGSLAGGLAALSDRSMKIILHRFPKTIAGLYPVLFKYIWGGPARIGFIAQEVKKLYPDAVLSINGVLHVNYAAIPIRG